MFKILFRWWAPKPTPPAPAWRTGTDPAALNRQPPGELTARDLPNRVGLPGRRELEGRTRG